MVIEPHIPLLEDILGQWEAELGKDARAYKNHVYRVLHFCMALHPVDAEAREKLVIAGAFHDLGIWTHDTLDYLPPSIDLANAYLGKHHLSQWAEEIGLMIDMHHKIGRYEDERFPLVEAFRKADLVDVSLGLVKCGLPKELITEVKARFPNAGFHRRLNQLAVSWFMRHPFNPAPFVKW